MDTQGNKRIGQRRHSISISIPGSLLSKDRRKSHQNGHDISTRNGESESASSVIRSNSTDGNFSKPSNGRRNSRASLYGLPDDCRNIRKLVRTSTSSSIGSSGSDRLPSVFQRRRSRSSLYGRSDEVFVDKLVPTNYAEFHPNRRSSISSTGSDSQKSIRRRNSRAKLYGLEDGETLGPVIPLNYTCEDLPEEEHVDNRSARRKRLDSWSDNEDFLNIPYDRRPNDKDSDYEDNLRDYRKGQRFRENC